MAVRIRLGIMTRFEPRREARIVALVNSGYEADTPQLLIPMRLAVELGLYQRLPEARIESFGTVGGPIRLYVLPSSIEVWVDEEDLTSPKTIVADAVISDIEVEALISDYLAGELEIAVEDFRRGLWRLRSDPPGRLRRSYPPQRWV